MYKVFEFFDDENEDIVDIMKSCILNYYEEYCKGMEKKCTTNI